MKPQCLLIAPTKYFYSSGSPEPVKHQMVTLLSHLTDLAEVHVFDLEMRFGFPQSEAEIDGVLGRCAELLSRYRPDVIAVSCYTSFDYLSSVDILRLCQRLFPGAVKVVGGYHPTAVPEDFLAEDVPVDYVVRGEGETIMRQIVGGEKLAAGTVLDGVPLDLCKERPLRYDLYPYEDDEVTMALSRGCPFQCTFCVQSDDFPNHYRRLDLGQIKEKIERLRAQMPVRRIVFTDPYFGVQRRHTMELLGLLVENFSDLRFWAETRIDTVRPEWLAMLSRLNMDLHFGVESLATDTLGLMQKAKNPGKYIENFHHTLELCQQGEILACCGFIQNYPGESLESYRATLSQLARAVERYDQVHFTFHCNQYSLYPGNRIYHQRHELARERGFSFPNDGWWRKREPDARARSERCIASSSIAAAFGDDQGFWKQDVLGLLKRYASKYSFKAFSFYRRDEIMESLTHHYPGRHISHWDGKAFGDQTALIRHLRYLLRDLYFRYEDWLRCVRPNAQEAFFRLFNLATFQHQERLLEQYDNGSQVDHLHGGIDLLYHQLVDELDRNVRQEGSDGGANLDLSLLGQRYRLSHDGKVHQHRSVERRAS